MFFLSKNWLRSQLKLIPINFHRPWWYLIVEQKKLFLLLTFISIIAHSFWAVSPFLIARVLTNGSIFYCALLFALWILIDSIYVIGRQLNARFQLQCIHSLYQSTHQYLLTVDPRYHVHRSSGTILGKIDRGARGYEDILDQITFEFVPLIVGVVIMLGALAYYSYWLAIIVFIVFVIMIAGGYYFARYACQPWERDFIKTDDTFRATAVENLAQVQLVRATYASDYMSDKLTEKIKENMRSEGNLWLSYTTATYTLNVLYLISLFCLLGVLAWQIKHGITTTIAAIALAIAYINSTKELLKITKPFRRYMRGWTAVTDLFSFIPEFGKQGFPVLGHAKEIPVTSNLSLHAHNISFDYETARLFNNHSFILEVDREQLNKLYGIIGPSGSGKTTFLSILGGQLKPIFGTVEINQLDIYHVNDATRRHLIALQGQIATSVRGTVKYNLLFGLPEDHNYTDEYLLSVLDKVGLTSVLAVHHGLETMLGEGGLNLSGGQRQRLNFAGLYLRSRFYNPPVILIDEPTSSLDEVSEAAITLMIEELAQSSLTLVIAHRLKTLESAQGLIDLSLLDQVKDIRIYNAEQLQKESAYYRQLIQGNVDFEVS